MLENKSIGARYTYTNVSLRTFSLCAVFMVYVLLMLYAVLGLLVGSYNSVTWQKGTCHVLSYSNHTTSSSSTGSGSDLQSEIDDAEISSSVQRFVLQPRFLCASASVHYVSSQDQWKEVSASNWIYHYNRTDTEMYYCAVRATQNKNKSLLEKSVLSCVQEEIVARPSNYSYNCTMNMVESNGGEYVWEWGAALKKRSENVHSFLVIVLPVMITALVVIVASFISLLFIKIRRDHNSNSKKVSLWEYLGPRDDSTGVDMTGYEFVKSIPFASYQKKMVHIMQQSRGLGADGSGDSCAGEQEPFPPQDVPPSPVSKDEEQVIDNDVLWRYRPPVMGQLANRKSALAIYLIIMAILFGLLSLCITGGVRNQSFLISFLCLYCVLLMVVCTVMFYHTVSRTMYIMTVDRIFVIYNRFFSIHIYCIETNKLDHVDYNIEGKNVVLGKVVLQHNVFVPIQFDYVVDVNYVRSVVEGNRATTQTPFDFHQHRSHAIDYFD